MKCIIIDDDPIFREVLDQYLQKEDAEIIGKFENASLAIPLLKKEEIDLIFLDLFMPEMTGHEFLDTLYPHLPQVILTTSDPSFALDAFKYNVTGYLVKPFPYSSFKKAFDKAVMAMTPKMMKDDQEQVFIKKGNSFKSVRKNEILFLECIGDYANIHTEKEKLILHGSMKELETIFPEPAFIRVHRSYIVRKDKIHKIEDDLIDLNGKHVPIGKTYRQIVYQKLKVL